MDAPLPFVTVSPDDTFSVNPAALSYLKQLSGRVAVVAIAGVYRSGKSYLLNQLAAAGGGALLAVAGGVGGGSASATGTPLAGADAPPPRAPPPPGGAFAVGPTVKATTKGIWLWGRGVEVEGGSMTVLFLDTEGLGSTVRSETYDARIFALALLLSSFFVYNSVGVIDGAAIAKLSYVAQLTRVIKVRAGGGGGGSGAGAAAAAKEDPGTEFAQHFPSFMWVVRDFAVKLEGRDGRKMSAREYLEEALKPEDGVSEAVEAKNAVRMMLRNFFPERDW